MVFKEAILALDLVAPLTFDLGPVPAPWDSAVLNLRPLLAPGAPWPSPKGLRWLLI